MTKKYPVQLEPGGVITIPKQLREQHNLADGDSLTLIGLSNDTLVLTKQHSQIDAASDQLAEEWRSSGESLDSMLNTLREVREKKKP
ncbi:MAG TPA: AbrB/MazE/SpoVT family DNA-binding domain-containing protein [Anaerolineales bacterium]|nr:AbrB/MazE/SpoVT family DNA-binding domain-containing protein [Anaerolineales bacterium]